MKHGRTNTKSTLKPNQQASYNRAPIVQTSCNRAPPFKHPAIERSSFKRPTIERPSFERPAIVAIAQGKTDIHKPTMISMGHRFCSTCCLKGPFLSLYPCTARSLYICRPLTGLQLKVVQEESFQTLLNHLQYNRR